MTESESETEGGGAPDGPRDGDDAESQQGVAPLRTPVYETVEKGAETETFENKGETREE